VAPSIQSTPRFASAPPAATPRKSIEPPLGESSAVAGAVADSSYSPDLLRRTLTLTRLSPDVKKKRRAEHKRSDTEKKAMEDLTHAKHERLLEEASSMAVLVTRADRRALLIGHFFFFGAGIGGMMFLLWVSGMSKHPTDVFSRFIIDSDEEIGTPYRMFVSGIVSLLAYCSVTLVAISHLIEVCGRGKSAHYNVLLVMVIALQAWSGTFVGKAVLQSCSGRSQPPPTPGGWGILVVSVLVFVLLGVLSASGMLRGGFGREGKQERTLMGSTMGALAEHVGVLPG